MSAVAIARLGAAAAGTLLTYLATQQVVQLAPEFKESLRQLKEKLPSDVHWGPPPLPPIEIDPKTGEITRTKGPGGPSQNPDPFGWGAMVAGVGAAVGGVATWLSDDDKPAESAETTPHPTTPMPGKADEAVPAKKVPLISLTSDPSGADPAAAAESTAPPPADPLATEEGKVQEAAKGAHEKVLKIARELGLEVDPSDTTGERLLTTLLPQLGFSHPRKRDLEEAIDLHRGYQKLLELMAQRRSLMNAAVSGDSQEWMRNVYSLNRLEWVIAKVSLAIQEVQGLSRRRSLMAEEEHLMRTPQPEDPQARRRLVERLQQVSKETQEASVMFDHPSMGHPW